MSLTFKSLYSEVSPTTEKALPQQTTMCYLDVSGLHIVGIAVYLNWKLYSPLAAEWEEKKGVEGVSLT